MKITLANIRANLVPVDALLAFVRPYGNRETFDLPDDERDLVSAAYQRLLTPVTGSVADVLVQAIGHRVSVIPLVTVDGARLTSVLRNWVPDIQPWNGLPRSLNCLTFVYDSGLRVTEWADMGDHGATLVVAADGTPAFYTVMTSDGYFDSMCAAGDAGMTFTIVDRLHQLDDSFLVRLVGDVDPARLESLPRGRQTAPARPAQEGMSLKQLYAAPPSPTGRAQLGRRR